ncbi:hypothetical protein [Xylanimonas protaetiae]|uniref:Histidine kinase n=1 Tax=Xylanimonas protaetiae TaxID=2509457 RepID=A0A4P6EZQ3_9MICO|nr:hypothetical protein [Xylanimonas protaetiae]QAY68940.1 hypothetical protein ET471_01840 [Xylanimonas protaetiae]
MRALRGALLVEAVILAAAAVGVLVDLLARRDFAGREIGMAVFLVACALGFAWALVAAGRRLLEGRRSGRALAMTWQLFQGIVGVTALATGSAWSVAIGVVLLALAVGVAAGLLMPRVVDATTRR